MAGHYDLDFVRAHGAPVCSAAIRARPEDFRVVETLGFAPGGRGEHLYLRVRKREHNTDWVARHLSRVLQIRARDVSYAGRKDRHAETTQWFSCWLPGRADPPLARLACDGVEILEARRHRSKLRIGALAGNRFDIRVRGLPGCETVRHALVERLERIASQGVPNYFGEQRFGHEGANLDAADRLLAGGIEIRDRRLRGLCISSARAYLFNCILAARVADGSWCATGEDARLSAPLYGVGARLDALERSILCRHRSWCDGLERLELRPEGRPLRLRVEDLAWEFPAASELCLRFGLPKGCYATAVLRELIEVDGVEDL